ncbi:hypothetical protein KIH87_00165 [Paraneptunicella aestuarii]|uniref:MvdC/MvdD family ATP grasp protein n=1 Tax=Paraneptunicella aestuarii TaxID=2831148 RepID=UPI001E48925D|nr:hypothetical protein [Paraneptunicella aestuarii]UAA38829.1 hypothetical protein KIH87_00165 [Paraneptunicella aestuarii]
MKVLISTILQDLHADAVKWALQKYYETECKIWVNSDIPKHQTLSISNLHQNELEVFSNGANNVNFKDFDVIWSRRFYVQKISKEYEETDRHIAYKNLEETLNGALSVANGNAFWINNHTSAMNAENKISQLQKAQQLGFHLPKTLISNDADEVLSFIESQNDKVIYKPLAYMDWRIKDYALKVFSSLVSSADFTSKEDIQSCPAIYQSYENKKLELRVIVMGSTCQAVAIDSQSHESSQIDWRLGDLEDKRPELSTFTLPDDMVQKCISLTHSLGLAYSAIDLILKPDGTFIFLEINPMGQFLWIEESLPEMRLLDIFCQFVLSASLQFKWDGSNSSATLEQYYQTEDYRSLMEDSHALHAHLET